VPDHQLTVPEQKSCGKDINGNPFLILCGTFLQKDSHFEMNDVGDFFYFLLFVIINDNLLKVKLSDKLLQTMLH
jgi:hypothetical protein